MKQKLKIRLFCLCLIASVNLPSIAQEAGKTNKFYGGFGYFMAGYEAFNLNKMNGAFKEAGYPELKNGTATIGGGGHYVMKNWLLGGEGAGLLGSTVENTNYKVVQAGGYGFFNIGYLVVRTPSFMLSPILGVGGGNLTLYIMDKNLITDSFEDILENPARESILATGGFLLNFSVMANYMVVGEKDEGYSGGFILGIKAGYVLNTSGNNWMFSGQSLKNAPAAGMSGPYISIVFGGGGIATSK